MSVAPTNERLEILQAMGITVWQLRSHAAKATNGTFPSYSLISANGADLWVVAEVNTPAELQLLQNIVKALNATLGPLTMLTAAELLKLESKKIIILGKTFSAAFKLEASAQAKLLSFEAGLAELKDQPQLKAKLWKLISHLRQ